MPKTISPALDAHRALHNTTLGWCVEAVRILSDNATYAFTTFNRPLVIDGVTYAPGFTRTAIASSADLTVDNLDMMGAITAAGITEEDIRSGKWDGAEIRFFEINWADLSQGRLMRRRGWLGEVRSGRSAFVAELHGLLRRLQQEIGRMFAPGCPWELGGIECGVRLLPPMWTATTPYTVREAHDAKTGSVVRPTGENGSFFRCTVAGTSGGSEPVWNVAGTTTDGSVTWQGFEAHTITLTVTAIVTERAVFQTNIAFADEWFTDGKLTWLTGLNVGTARQFVKRYLNTNGQVELRKAMFFPIAIGDTATIEAGCFKRATEDCQTKFDNIYNFGGFPDLTGLDNVITSGVT